MVFIASWSLGVPLSREQCICAIPGVVSIVAAVHVDRVLAGIFNVASHCEKLRWTQQCHPARPRPSCLLPPASKYSSVAPTSKRDYWCALSLHNRWGSPVRKVRLGTRCGTRHLTPEDCWWQIRWDPGE